MVTATKTSTNSTTSSIDISSKASNTNLSSKFTSELYKQIIVKLLQNLKILKVKILKMY